MDLSEYVHIWVWFEQTIAVTMFTKIINIGIYCIGFVFYIKVFTDLFKFTF